MSTSFSSMTPSGIDPHRSSYPASGSVSSYVFPFFVFHFVAVLYFFLFVVFVLLVFSSPSGFSLFSATSSVEFLEPEGDRYNGVPEIKIFLIQSNYTARQFFVLITVFSAFIPDFKYSTKTGIFMSYICQYLLCFKFKMSKYINIYSIFKIKQF